MVDCLSRLLTQAADMGLIKGAMMGSEPLHIHHLQFADDTILFSIDDDEAIKNLFHIVKTFEKSSGLNINLSKSEVLGINLERDRILSIAESPGCKVSNWPNSYLGLPLNANPNSMAFWTPMLEKIERRLHSWQNTYVSKGGRHTLIQATLSNLPTYYLSLFALPNRVAMAIEKVYRNFLWRGSDDSSSMHLVPY